MLYYYFSIYGAFSNESPYFLFKEVLENGRKAL